MSPFFTVSNKKLCCADFLQLHLHVLHLSVFLLPLLHFSLPLLHLFLPLHSLFATFTPLLVSLLALFLCLSSALLIPFCFLCFLAKLTSKACSAYAYTARDRERERVRWESGGKELEQDRGHVKLSICQSKSLPA